MGLITRETPFEIQMSFSKLVKAYEQMAKENNGYRAERAKRVLQIAKDNPVLINGFTDWDVVDTHKEEIECLLEDTFSPILSSNEIKVATIPFENVYFKSSERFDEIIQKAGADYELKIRNFEEEHLYILACSVILKEVYGVELNFKRPLFYDIPDENGLIRHYKILYNAELTELYPTRQARRLSKEDIDLLLDNFNNIDIWREKIPPRSWILKGFVIANMVDITTEESISTLKSNLLYANKNGPVQNSVLDGFESIFQRLFRSRNIRVGFSVFNKSEGCLEKVYKDGIVSYLLNKQEEMPCNKVLCAKAFDTLFEKNQFFAISDVDKYLDQTNEAEYEIFRQQGIRSAILAPITNKGEMLGIIEVVSPEVGFLNSVTAYKLVDVIPYIVASVIRAKEEESNLIEAVIQHECTSIHPSVQWRFEKEARRFLKERMSGNDVAFRELVFKDVLPLYGQVDIRNSSMARNDAIRKDLIIQLSNAEEIMAMAFQENPLPIYEELLFRMKNYMESIRENLFTYSEQNILDFMKEDIHPLFEEILEDGGEITERINYYMSTLDPLIGSLYDHRKNYDTTVTQINKTLARILDKEQEGAQAMFPHFFERYKTDGVEHNLYIGSSISSHRKYSEKYLYNLRLWQLQAMCKMENAYYKLLPELPVKLDVASLVLVHNTPLSIRFRMDEKRFDVDGTYNARYEILKKRLDKAFVKGTDERVTQKGKITIVYSQRKEEREYMRYIRFLQSRHQLSSNVEIVELEELQGVSGLKAIRVEVLYTKPEDEKEYYTYEDLMAELRK
ncbi:GAF domain-containing protein [Robertkochia solimangrovi]|uniref:GAF domain-containing protein n=1 Tax=Robertkochia solimangrovi TaxID=2213046 RepID=UPI0011807AA9|nr:GAF domain-containing protein [Robertkochia solimangrovi]TRZ41884.1 GAF domain-containing protein [Robertkochia solimangrovi]